MVAVGALFIAHWKMIELSRLLLWLDGLVLNVLEMAVIEEGKMKEMV